jgi:plastocyanin
MLNGTINSTGLQDAYQQWASSVSISVGDSIEFNYEEGAHTVHLLSNSADFAACNTGSGVTLSTSGPPTTYVVKPTDPSTLYFICTVDSHCLDGQKVAIDIKGTGLTPVSPPVSPPVATPSGSAGNHLHHSLEMVPLLLAITSYLIFLGHLQ